MAFNCGEDPDVLAERWSERSLRELGILHAHESPLEERLDFWMSQQVAASINPWRQKGAVAVMPKDLMPDWWKGEDEVQSAGDMANILKGMTLAAGGKVS